MENEKKQAIFSVTKKDLRIDFFRAGGKGGQKQNKTSSACRITHIESGAVGESREERHQHMNKKTAFNRMIKSKRFQDWLKIQSAMVMQGYRDIEQKVEKTMRTKNLKVEVKDENDNWVNIENNGENHG